MSFQLRGRVILTAHLQTLTGLHIGADSPELSIGGIDLPVLGDGVTKRPFVPGSSLRGKMRSLLERVHGREQNQSIGSNVSIHLCKTAAEWKDCPVCPVFGVPSNLPSSQPTRLLVRDLGMTDSSARLLDERLGKRGLQYTEAKTEVAIDRVTSAATPRTIERVPAGIDFDVELSYAVYEDDDLDRFRSVLFGMALLEADYLGGQGSRGYGKVQFADITLEARDYRNPDKDPDKHSPGSAEHASSKAGFDEVYGWMLKTIPLEV